MVCLLWYRLLSTDVILPARSHRCMKNQYFGDVNDYQKYGLLRLLAEGGRRRILVCWMLTSDDSGSDGRRLSYLENPGTWRSFDPQLFDSLRRAVGTGDRRLEVVREKNLIPGGMYFEKPLRGNSRGEYFKELHQQCRSAELIFFDPDNGMQVPSVPTRSPKADKYLFWEEAKDLFTSGRSLLVYQHFPRVNRRRYIREMSRRFSINVGAPRIVTFRTSSVVYFLCINSAQVEAYRRIADKVSRRWGNKFIISRYPS